MKKIILATGQSAIDEAIVNLNKYEIVETIRYKEEILNAIKDNDVDIIVFSEGLIGSEYLIEEILKVSKEKPTMRIIYLAGEVDGRNKAKVHSLGTLVISGIHDIVTRKKLSSYFLEELLENPMTFDSVKHLIKDFKKESSIDDLIQLEDLDETLDDTEEKIKNVFTISSFKPGSGKTFVASNIAVAIAEYGIKKDGEKPKVALIEADLQNLSVGTILQMENSKYNLKTVMDKISTVFSDKGDLDLSPEKVEAVDKFIMKGFQTYTHVRNLEALVGSELTFDELEDIKPYYYIYLIESIRKNYDIVIVDTNSALTHVTTFPLLKMANTCFYVLNLDFNNVRNNVRYQNFLKELGIQNKVKYILNQDIDNTQKKHNFTGTDVEKLLYTSSMVKDAGFTFEAEIPSLPTTVFLNRLYQGTPVVLDNKKYTLKAKYEILKVANKIWTIKNLEKIKEDVEKYEKKNKKSSFFDFS